MKNYSKMTLFVLSFLFLFSISNVSASHFYNTYTYTDSLVYTEDHKGEHRGFALAFPEDKYGIDCGYKDWTYNARKCKRTALYDYQYVEYYGYNAHKDANSYDRDKIFKEAFKTYQQNSKYEYQLELKRIEEENRNRYRNYGGYGHGYSGHRYYTYGW
ncbi:MAG: hypothetical protein AABX23_05055 [Nanoarchaeota archaeon]